MRILEFPCPGMTHNTILAIMPPLFYQFGATIPAYGPKRLFLAVLDPFGGPLAPPDGSPWPAKLFQCITGDVPWLVPPLFHTVPPVWSHQIHLWPKKAVFDRFGLFWGPSGTPRWPSLTPKTVPMHHRGCALTCSTLVPHCSTSLEPPAPLMAQKGRFWPFWTLFGHISGQNGWNKGVAHWNKSILTKTKQKTSLVVMENQLRKSHPH